MPPRPAANRQDLVARQSQLPSEPAGRRGPNKARVYLAVAQHGAAAGHDRGLDPERLHAAPTLLRGVVPHFGFVGTRRKPLLGLPGVAGAPDAARGVFREIVDLLGSLVDLVRLRNDRRILDRRSRRAGPPASRARWAAARSASSGLSIRGCSRSDGYAEISPFRLTLNFGIPPREPSRRRPPPGDRGRSRSRALSTGQSVSSLEGSNDLDLGAHQQQRVVRLLDRARPATRRRSGPAAARSRGGADDRERIRGGQDVEIPADRVRPDHGAHRVRPRPNAKLRVASRAGGHDHAQLLELDDRRRQLVLAPVLQRPNVDVLDRERVRTARGSPRAGRPGIRSRRRPCSRRRMP